MRKFSAPQIALIVAALTLGSKFIGFIREIIKANYYGTSYVVDSLGISESIPSMIFAGVLAATATSFMPLFSEKMEKEGELAANRYTSQVINILVIISVIASIVGIIFSEQIVTFFTMPDILAPTGSGPIEKAAWFVTHGWMGEKAQLASFYVNVTFSYMLFSSVAGILESYIKYKGVFVRQVIAGYSISMMMIVGLIVSRVVDDPRLIVVGSLAGNIVRLIIIALIAKHEKYKYTFDFHMTDTVRRIFTMALPIFVGSSVAQISSFVDNMLATGLDTGNVASLSYSSLLIGLASGLTSSIIATMIYPKMSQAFTNGDERRFSDLFTNGLMITLMLGIPLAIASVIYNEQVIQIVYERGAFSGASTELTARAFLCLAPGLVFIMISGVMINAFYSRQQTKLPLLISLASISVNIVFDLLLVGRYGNAGLASATSLSQVVGAVLYVVIIKASNPHLIQPGFASNCMKVIVAAAVSVGGTAPIYFGVMFLATNNGWIMPRAALLLATTLAAIAVYALLLHVMKVNEIRHFREIAGLFRKKSGE
ncbi:MAG: murein biosynthesis integral membrane protein MurJ [Clostridiales Family XIII bacterium]|jgi:putative peptidoglycan lipid II flippase|nr:murein biosynthesis integral membrane protein MurJ [Clostridiales Family XIII bacterium]